MTILLVDNEPAFLAMMKEVLEEAGHAVISASDGKEAREVLDASAIDLIVSDVYMPTLDGAGFHSYVRDFTDRSDIPFVFMSGSGAEENRELIVDPGVDFFLSKATPIDEIVRFLGRLGPGKQGRSG